MTKCKATQHVDKPMRGGKRQRCVHCGDVFPCGHACGHFDCILARGGTLPDWADVRPSTESTS